VTFKRMVAGIKLEFGELVLDPTVNEVHSGSRAEKVTVVYPSTDFRQAGYI
jgi:hypothetical protein